MNTFLVKNLSEISSSELSCSSPSLNCISSVRRCCKKSLVPLSPCPTFVHNLASATMLISSNCQGSLAVIISATELKEEWSLERAASKRVRDLLSSAFPYFCTEKGWYMSHEGEHLGGNLRRAVEWQLSVCRRRGV